MKDWLNRIGIEVTRVLSQVAVLYRLALYKGILLERDRDV